jgi:hypothetical protein
MRFRTLQEEETMPFLTLQETMEPTNAGEGGWDRRTFHDRPFLYRMGFLTLQEIEWLRMEMGPSPQAFLPYQDINSFGVLKIPPGAEAERNHKAFAKTPGLVPGKRAGGDLLIKTFLQKKRRQKRIEQPQAAEKEKKGTN